MPFFMVSDVFRNFVADATFSKQNRSVGQQFGQYVVPPFFLGQRERTGSKSVLNNTRLNAFTP